MPLSENQMNFVYWRLSEYNYTQSILEAYDRGDFEYIEKIKIRPEPEPEPCPSPPCPSPDPQQTLCSEIVKWKLIEYNHTRNILIAYDRGEFDIEKIQSLQPEPEEPHAPCPSPDEVDSRSLPDVVPRSLPEVDSRSLPGSFASCDSHLDLNEESVNEIDSRSLPPSCVRVVDFVRSRSLPGSYASCDRNLDLNQSAANEVDSRSLLCSRGSHVIEHLNTDESEDVDDVPDSRSRQYTKVNSCTCGYLTFVAKKPDGGK